MRVTTKGAWIVLAAAALAVQACSSSPDAPGRPSLPAGRLPAALRIGTTATGRLAVRSISLEDYVEATILSEFAPAAGDPEVVERMFEVQAVLARTYGVGHRGRHAADGYDLCDRTHCQLFQPERRVTSRWAPQAAAAVRRTRGEVLWFAGAPALAVFHADCGGRTSSAADVWGGTARPYLIGRPDDGDAAAAHLAWEYRASRSALLAALNADPATRVGARFDTLEVLDRDPAGRIEHISVRGTTPHVVSGAALRTALTNAFGARSIRSTWFDIRTDAGGLVFTGRGFGHGVGLCQAGALARLRAGASVSAVLQRYFPGTRLLRSGR